MRVLFLSFIMIPFLLGPVYSLCQGSDGQIFDWLIGSWEGPVGDGLYIEKWKENKVGELEGLAYLIMQKDTTLKEELHIRKFGKHWTYIAIINGSTPTMFTLKDISSSTYVFENKEHDFPQRVVYNRSAKDKLTAWVEGNLNGKNVKEEFYLKRIKNKQH